MRTHTFENLELNADKPSSDTIEVIYDKQPITLENGTVANHINEIDLEPSAEMMKLAQQAESLKYIPELERLEAVIDLLRANVEYPFKATVEKLQAENAELAEWIKDKLLPGGSGKKLLSEVFTNGYGVCNELSVAYLWLAQHAGLKGILLSSVPYQITNVNRADSEEPLFKATAPGEKVVGHSWVEILTDERGWVPVDPSTKYVGNTDEKFATFQRAGYDAHLFVDGLVSVDNPEALRAIVHAEPLPPGSETVKVLTSVALHQSRKKLSTKEKDSTPRPPKHSTFTGHATVQFHEKDSDHVGFRLSNKA